MSMRNLLNEPKSKGVKGYNLYIDKIDFGSVIIWVNFDLFEILTDY